MGELRIGTSGWNYPTGPGKWNGIFYPATRSKRAGTKDFDELRYYAEHFNTVEVNSTFYGQPRADVTRGWVDRTPRDFEFSLKLYQKFTHPKMFKEAARLRADPTHDRARARQAHDHDPLLDLLAHVTQSDIDDYRMGVEPLAKAGRIGALLAQFPASFKDTPSSREYLTQLLGAFSDYRVAVELRHKSWSDAFAETIGLLNGFGAALVQIDEPKFKLSIRQNWLPNITGFYYVRLHGRNAKQWWHHEHRDDRYNYLYTAQELQEFAETASAAKELVKKSYLYTNNHFAAKSIVNAVMLKAQLGEPIDGEYPPALVDEYPDIKDLVPITGESSRVTSRAERPRRLI